MCEKLLSDLVPGSCSGCAYNPNDSEREIERERERGQERKNPQIWRVEVKEGGGGVVF